MSHAYPGDRPDVTQFTTVIDQLVARHATLTAACAPTTPTTTGQDDAGQGDVVGAGPGLGEVTVVFDAGQNSVANFEHLAAAGLGYIGSVPPSDTPDLLALPARRRKVVDPDRFAGLTALDPPGTQTPPPPGTTAPTIKKSRKLGLVLPPPACPGQLHLRASTAVRG